MSEPLLNIETILEQALNFTSSEARLAYVRGVCRDNEQLRVRIEGLIEAHEAAGGFLAEKPRVEESTIGSEPRSEEAPGTVIGHYKLLEKIGEGGCGVVYVAEQSEPVRRRVALKIIKLGMDTKSVVARFEAERQALALMDHPNIAKVLDAGATETGRPYFVMELVRGLKITDYCDRRNLSTRERLALFVQVCHAIQHAHQKGIIHRDIKPSNVLVTVNDGVAVPIVIDFGIAKATSQQRLTDKTVYTAFEQFLGTPAYMSPEQAEMTSLDIDTRSDVYALGVLLYELLTGKTPFDPKTLVAAGLEEMRRIIREQEPMRPSTRLMTMMAGELTTTAQRRQSEPPKLIQVVRGDLDWIVMKCLDKDRARRYETANGLARDIERHLDHEPVTARPPSAAYRIQKFARRNKVMVTAGVTVAAALVLGTLASTWQAVRASANEHKARQAQANEAKQRLAAVNAMGFARTNELRARQNAYAADVKIADTAWREHNLGRALAALRRQMPKSGEADLRGIEWRYLWQKCQGQQLKTFRHEAEVTAAELSPDGRWLATESGGAFWIWDTRKASRRALSSAAPRDAGFGLVSHLTFDPRGRFLATATDREVLIWHLPDWRQVQSLPATNAGVAFSGDGTVFGSFGEEGIQVWKAATWEPVIRLGEISLRSAGQGRRIALNRDGSLLAESWLSMYRPESQAEGEVAVWRIPQREALFGTNEVNGVKDANGLAFSGDDHWLAACTFGPPASVWLWSVPERRLAARWIASQGLGRALAFAPDSKHLATAGSEQVISLWETGDTDPRPELLQGHSNEVCSLRFAADGRLVSASNDKTVCLWETRPGPINSPPFSFPSSRLICAQPADSTSMLAVNLTNLTFEQWDMERGQCVRRTTIQGAGALLRGGDFVKKNLLGMTFDADVPAGGGRVKILFPLRDSGPRAWNLCATTGDGRVYAWNAESGDLVYSNKVGSRPLLAFPVTDHRKLVLAEWSDDRDLEGPLRSYDLQTHQTESIEEHVGVNPCALKVSPDGRFFAYITTNGLVKVWDGARKQTKSVVGLPWLGTIDFSPDSRWLAVAPTFGGWARVWDVGTGAPVSEELAGYLAGIWKVSFSADSRSLVTYCWDGTARIWNIATSREMISDVPLNWFLKFAFAWTLLPTDGNSVLESAGEGSIRVVRLPSLAGLDTAEKQ